MKAILQVTAVIIISAGVDPRGSLTRERNPWEALISLSVEYRPTLAGKKLGFNAMVYNVLNQQRAEQVSPVYGYSSVVDSGYEMPQFYTEPRYFRFGITCDF